METINRGTFSLTRRTMLAGILGTTATTLLASCGGGSGTKEQSAPANTVNASVSSSTTPTQAPARTTSTGDNKGSNLDAAHLLTKEEIEAVLGQPVADATPVKPVPNGTLSSFRPLYIQVERGRNVSSEIPGFKRTYDLTDPVPGLGDEAWASMHDIVVRRGETLLYIGTVATTTDVVTADKVKALAQKAIARA